MKMSRLIQYDGEADDLIVTFKNRPSDETRRFLFESAIALDEGKSKQWPGGYQTRLDKRPTNQGGNQIHIEGPRGQKWAYRFDGSRSEPSKYSMRTTNRVRDIASQALAIEPERIEEVHVTGLRGKTLLIEIAFN
jgi:hypothetical protein